MLDIKYVVGNAPALQENANRRNVAVDVGHAVDKYKEKVALIQQVESLRSRRKKIAQSFQAPESDKTALQEEARQVNEEEQRITAEIEKVDLEFVEEALKIPNLTHPDVPNGESEDNNVVLRTVGERREFDFEPLDHLELGKRLDIIDFDAGANVAGSKFYYLKNDGALLENALVQYALQIALKHGFKPLFTPIMAKDSIVEGAGFNPRGEGVDDHIFKVGNLSADTKEKVLNLIGTSEITIGGYFAGKVLEEKDLPTKVVGISDCFRKESGTGRLNKWLYRVPHFKKVEMFQFVKPGEWDKILQDILEIEEKIFQELGIPYRVQNICAGDMGGPAYRKFDIEAWMPAIEKGGRYGEVTSCSDCTDFQARRWNIKYKDAQGKKHYVHTLNGTAVATTRVLLSILENFQNADGSVTIPEALRPFMYGKEVIDGK